MSLYRGDGRSGAGADRLRGHQMVPGPRCAYYALYILRIVCNILCVYAILTIVSA